MTRTVDHPTMEEMDLYLRRARRARSEAITETGHWLGCKIRAAYTAIAHPRRNSPHGSATA